MCVRLTSQPKYQRKLVPNIIHICKLLIINLATSATPESTFSSERNIKTWQRSTTKAKRYNSFSLLYKELTDQIDIVDVGNKFVEKYEERKNIFGNFQKRI